MPWFKVDDSLHSHPKVRRAGLAAMGLWAVAGSYSSQYVTEGFIPEWFVLAQKSGRKLADSLVAAGLWDRSERAGESGYQFHDWGHFQMTKAEVEATRERNRERQRKYREKRHQAGSDTVSNGVTNSGSNGPPTLPYPTQPNPTLPTSKKQEEVGSEAYVSNARGTEHHEGLSRSFPAHIVKIANRYTDKVGLSDRSKVCTVVEQAVKSGYISTSIEDALDRLVANRLPVTADTLRIEIEGRRAPARASPSRHDENAAVVEQIREMERATNHHQIEAR